MHISRCEFVSLLACVCRNMGRPYAGACVLSFRLRARARAAGMHGACACFRSGCVRSPCGRRAFASRVRRALGINKGVGLCIDLCKQVSFRDNGVRLLKTHRARTVSRLGTGGGDSHTLLFQVFSTHAERPRKPIRAKGSRLWPTAGGSVPGITV